MECKIATKLGMLAATVLAGACVAQQPPDKPDLIPVRTSPGYCEIDESVPGVRRLIVTTTNQGAPIPASRPLITTRIVFSARQIFRGLSLSGDIPSGWWFPTGLQYQQTFDIPAEAFEPDLFFTITVDSNNVIDESNELNNTVSGVCAG